MYFDGHKRDDVIAYCQEFIRQLASLTSVVADGEKRYLRVAHDESTFYANTDQTQFWNDGKSQALWQKSQGSSIMVSDSIVEGHGMGILKDDEETARLYLETKDILIAKCLLHKFAIKFLRGNFQWHLFI